MNAVCAMHRLLKAQQAFGDRFGRLIAWLNLAIITVLLYEVCARYLLNAPTSWAHETSTMIFGGYCLAAGVYTQTHNKHVRIDVIYQLFGDKGRAWMDCFSSIFIVAALGFLLYVSSGYAYESWSIKEVSSKSPWRPLLFPIKTVIPITVLLLILNQCIYFMRDFMIATGIMHALSDDMNFDERDGSSN